MLCVSRCACVFVFASMVVSFCLFVFLCVFVCVCFGAFLYVLVRLFQCWFNWLFKCASVCVWLCLVRVTVIVNVFAWLYGCV